MRHRAQIPRDEALSGGAGIDEPDPVLPCRACTRPAALLLATSAARPCREARPLPASRWEFIYKIGLPNAVPDILAGMRLSLTVALILAVVGELLAAQEGLGTAVLHAARSYRAADLYAGILLLGMIGLVSNYSLAVADKRILAWKN
ncbi:MAG: ABC transporter permease subunit [Xanthobacteraceae bacterium]|nr:ABC transporter permease subunit [Xanthobacteraceae bacterium]